MKNKSRQIGDAIWGIYTNKDAPANLEFGIICGVITNINTSEKLIYETSVILGGEYGDERIEATLPEDGTFDTRDEAIQAMINILESNLTETK